MSVNAVWNPTIAELTAPTDAGGVLVWPAPTLFARLAHSNRQRLNASLVMIADETLRHWRYEARMAIGADKDAFVVATGHQPEFIHAGVWAKNVVASRLAQAMRGIAVNISVDNDIARSYALQLPRRDSNGCSLQSHEFPHEFTSAIDDRVSPAMMNPFELATAPIDVTWLKMVERMQADMGRDFAASLLPPFLAGFGSCPTSGWTDRMTCGRRAVDSEFGLELVDTTVSESLWSPILVDAVLHAERFAANYNSALEAYRKLRRVRSTGRPMPPLARDGDAIESPFWAYRAGTGRRRLFVQCKADRVYLLADGAIIAEFSLTEWRDAARRRLDPHRCGGWRIRPRALMLTIWARLLLSDFFIHGIGGAKYDQIANQILAGYYQMVPPEYACVSATLWLDAGPVGLARHEAASACRRLRDLRMNPQRYVGSDAVNSSAIEERRSAVSDSVRLRTTNPGDRTARRMAFDRIRRASERLASVVSYKVAEAQERLAKLEALESQRRIVESRELFFALFPRSVLEALCAALPAAETFRAS